MDNSETSSRTLLQFESYVHEHVHHVQELVIEVLGAEELVHQVQELLLETILSYPNLTLPY